MITEKLWRSLIMTTTVIEAHLHPRTSQCRRVCLVPAYSRASHKCIQPHPGRRCGLHGSGAPRNCTRTGRTNAEPCWALSQRRDGALRLHAREYGRLEE